MTMRKARVKAYRQGVLAETVVALLLRLKGHRIVARRYATPVGEIDLVALKGKRLAFIEVKRRKTMDDAAWSVTAKQRRRIVRAAQYWLASHPGFAGHDIAFDVVLAAPWTWPRVIANAFPV
ncbi:MAG: YraN family protein [Methyloceanibacter sp.]|jgi:putative endonuclease|nr:YraN family protein [Methyloceanibacter sp.]